MAKMFFPQFARGREGIDLVVGENVLEHIRRIGNVQIGSECGGQGICGKDIIRVEGGGLGSLTEMSAAERSCLEQGTLVPGQRLACQAKVTKVGTDIRVFIRDFGKYTILTDVIDTGVELNPFVFRKNGRVLYQTGEDLGAYQGKMLGLAIDVGTTTIVMQVVDLATGENLGKPIASENPQIAYGNDVISRGGYIMTHDGGLKELQAAVFDGVNRSLNEFEKQSNVEKGSITKYIYDVVAVGNSTMRSIICGQDPSTLAVLPFEPIDTRPVTLETSEVGLEVNPKGKMYGPPQIGGHAGADCLADIIATRLYQSAETQMVIDIGTNGEVVVGNKDRILTASCAAGGAYEGYQTRCGVGAVEGAITKIRIDDGQAVYETLGNKNPVGICGSGMIDLLAELLRNGIMNEKARIKEDYHLTQNITISQEDINQLIIAKAGLRIDQDLLIEYYGTNLDGVAKVYLAGAFGNYMNVNNAMRIGLLPQEKRRDAERVARIIQHKKPNEIEGENFIYMIASRMYF